MPARIVRDLVEVIAALDRRTPQVHSPSEAAIIREDGTFAYPIREEIPVMLIDEAIPLHDGLPPLRYVPPSA